MAKAKSPVSWMTDTLQNLVSMLGTTVDKGSHNQFVFAPMDKNQLECAYRGDWVARKIVTIPAQDATREWREWKADDKQIETLEAYEKKLQLRRKVRVGMIKARLYGGGGLILGFGDGQHESPLDPETVKKDGLKFVHPFARHEVTCGEPDGDLNGANYGLPSFYTVSNTNPGTSAPQTKVHPSRIVRFSGAEVPDRALSVDGWDDSVLEAVLDAVKNVSASTSSIASLLQELKIDIVHIPGFMEGMQSSDYRSKILERFSLVNRAKSIVNTMLLDKEEEWERVEASLAGVPDVMKLYLLIASGAADIPATRLISQSPQGLNATGDGDLRNYYDNVRSTQTNEVTPALEALDECLIRSALGSRPESLWYEWRALWQMTPKEKADVLKTKADTVKVLSDTSLVEPEVLAEGVRGMLVDDGSLPGIEQAYEEFEKNGEGVDENDPEVQAQFGQTKERPETPGRPELKVVSGGRKEQPLNEDAIRSLVRSIMDEFNEEQVERDKDGKFSSQGGGGLSSEEEFGDAQRVRGVSGKVSGKESASFEEYSGGGYEKMNQSLRKGGDGGREEAVNYDMRARDMVKEMDRVMARSSLPKEINGERLVSPAAYKVLEKSVGKTIEDKGFVSVSSDASYLKQMEGRENSKSVRVVLPKGSRAVDISSMSMHEGENEVVVDRGSRFKVSRDKDGGLVLKLQKQGKK